MRACAACAALMVGCKADAYSFLLGCRDVLLLLLLVPLLSRIATAAEDVLAGRECEHEHEVNAAVISGISATTATALSTDTAACSLSDSGEKRMGSILGGG